MNSMIINNQRKNKTKKQKHSENQKKYREKKKLNPVYMAKKKNKQPSNNNNSDKFQSVVNKINNFDNIPTIPIQEIIFIDELIATESEYWLWTVNNCSDCILLSTNDYFNKFSIN